MEFTLEFILFIVVVQFCAAFVKGLAGFGDPLISSPLLSLTSLQNNEITPANLLLQWPVNGYFSIKNRKSFSIKSTIPMLVFILIGMVPGLFLLKYGTSWVIKALLGLVIVICGVEMLTRKESSKTSGNFIVMALVSIASGFCAGMFGINLFFVAYIERTGYVDRKQFRGQMCFIFFIENTVRFFIYLFTGFYSLMVVELAAFSAIGYIIGLFAGSRVDSHLSEKTIKTVVTIVFIFAGISTFVKAAIFKS